MSLALRNQLNLFKVISDIKDENVRKHVLGTLKKNKGFFKALREIAKNTVNGAVPLSAVQKKKLKKYKRTIVTLSCCKRKNCKDRCKLLKQSGGFLPILIPSIISILGSLLQK